MLAAKRCELFVCSYDSVGDRRVLIVGELLVKYRVVEKNPVTAHENKISDISSFASRFPRPSQPPLRACWAFAQAFNEESGLCTEAFFDELAPAFDDDHAIDVRNLSCIHICLPAVDFLCHALLASGTEIEAKSRREGKERLRQFL